MKDIIKRIEELGSDNVATFGGKFEGGIHLQQIPDEIAPVIEFLQEKEIENYLEIGSAAGGLVYLLNDFLDLKKILIIDDNMHPKARLRSDILSDIDYDEIIGNSQDEETVEAVNIRFDLMTIDADHSFQGITKDFETYTPMLKKGGYLIFHDTVHWSTPGVHRFIDVLKKAKNYKLIGEYISETHVSPCGVALFQKN